MFKSLIWKFDMCIYRLFYWRWKDRLIYNDRIRRLFLEYLLAWENVYNDKNVNAFIKFPNFPEFPFPESEKTIEDNKTISNMLV